MRIKFTNVPMIFAGIMIAFVSIFYFFSIYSPSDKVPLPIRPKFIAHGGGFIPNIGKISNSEEALSYSYEKGYKIIEVDFHWTKDDQLVLIHDWGWAFGKWFDYDKNAIPNLKEFLALNMKNNLTQLDFNGLLGWMRNHSEVAIITDVKKNNLKAIKFIHDKAGELTNRFIPQAYSRAEYDDIKDLGFDRIVLTLYNTKAWNFQLIHFVDNNPDIFAITMRPERAMQGNFGMKLKLKGIFIYCHTINDPGQFSRLQGYGVSGIYTDYLIGNEESSEIYDQQGH